MDALGIEGTASELVVEIGAGRGALTERLSGRAKNLAAIEIDPLLAAGLRERFAGRPHVRIIEADILALPLGPVISPIGGATGAGKALAVGNLPYYITSPILMRLFETAELLKTIVVMVQREVAERITAAPGGREYGALSVTAQYYTRPELLFRIPPGAFRPPPEVDSALVRMSVTPRDKRPAGDEQGFLRFVRLVFRQKRKTLRNNLKGEYPAETSARAMENLGVSPSARAETLSVERLAALYKLLS